DLITEADQELTDILGADTELIYYFIGEGQEFDQDRIVNILNSAHVPCEKLEQVIQFMLYYSFLGIKVAGENPRYIFDVGYDLKLLNVLARKAENLLYVLNPAFYPALNL
ncbi:MAG TPA: hypothetical protein VFE66_02215, partial [Bacteroidales bacterium]|nr:hypothetical protein [Bacteroidales bacterium]